MDESWFAYLSSELGGLSTNTRNLFALYTGLNGNRSFPVSTILDKYKVGKVIGDGNFAVVKECVERLVLLPGLL